MQKAKSSYSMMKGKDLEEMRNKSGKSQASFADALGVSLRMYSYYECDKKPIPKTVELSSRYILSEKLRCTIYKPSSDLTDFDIDRIGRLRYALQGVEGFDDRSDKIVRQSADEIEYLLSKFD
jgi:transcriptional regulator with XRE-family HTH domain